LILSQFLWVAIFKLDYLLKTIQKLKIDIVAKD